MDWKKLDVQTKETDLNFGLNFPMIEYFVSLSVGYHNGGLNMKDRSLVEGLFLKGDIQILCTTNTLAHGINLPAHTVVVKSTQYL